MGADPTHLNFQVNTNAAQFQAPQAPQARARQQQFQQAPVRQQQFQQAPVQRQQFAPARPAQQAAPVPSASSVPNCADCAGINPFINPADSSHAQLFAQSQIPQQPAAPAFRQPATPSFRQPASTFVPQQQSFQQQPIQPAFLQQQQPAQPTFRQPQQPAPAQAAPSNFPQGQLNLNRFESGFNFDFSS